VTTERASIEGNMSKYTEYNTPTNALIVYHTLV